MKNLILIAAGVTAWYLIQQKKAVDLLQYFTSSVSARFDGVTPILILKIGVENVTNQSFTIESFVGTLSSNGQLIGNVTSFIPLKIMPTSVNYYTVEVRMSLLGITTDIINSIFGQGGLQQKVVLAGHVNANGIVMPVTLNYTIG